MVYILYEIRIFENKNIYFSWIFPIFPHQDFVNGYIVYTVQSVPNYNGIRFLTHFIHFSTIFYLSCHLKKKYKNKNAQAEVKQVVKNIKKMV